MSGGIKKWFMLQMWRVQQVAQILTIALLAVNLTLQLYTYMKWREGDLFATPYIGGSIILLVLLAGVWAFALIWDLRLKMWREQMTVVVEKNPFTKEKMTPKEIMVYGILWLPMLDRLAKEDPKIKESADAMRRWVIRSMKEDRIAEMEVGTILEYIGAKDMDFLDMKNGK